MTKTTIILLILTVFGFVSYAQTNNSSFKKQYFKAEELIDLEKYNEAANIFSELLKSNTQNDNLNFKLGYCLMNSSLNDKDAIIYLQKAVKSISLEYNYDDYKEKASPIETYFYLAKAQHFNYEFEKARINFNKFKEYLTDEDVDLKKQIDKEIEECNNGEILIKYPFEMTITNIGSNLNSEYDDHSPIFTADESTLIFTSKRENGTNNKILENEQYWENIYICNKKENGNWSEPKSISSNINKNKNIASISLSIDGQEAYLYQDDKGDGNIYITHLEGDEWTVPEKLPETINSKAKEAHASISADGSTLYFSSNREGGFGGSDIYIVKRLPNGEWGQAMNIGPEINTEYDEESPFIHPDEVTLFFSSKGHDNIGGFDIFFTMTEGEGWMEVTNMGYPINTTGDDVFYSPTPDGKRAYYSSKQKDGFGGSDIYLISLPEKDEVPLIFVSDQATEEVIATTENTNEAIIINEKYIISYVLFDFDKYKTNKYKKTLDNLSQYLKKNKDAKVAIYAYADALGSYEYNLTLTTKRADFVKKYLINNGVESNQIETYAKSNKDFISKNTSPDSRKYNRRVDFKIIKPGKSEIKIEKVSVPDKYKL